MAYAHPAPAANTYTSTQSSAIPIHGNASGPTFATGQQANPYASPTRGGSPLAVAELAGRGHGAPGELGAPHAVGVSAATGYAGSVSGGAPLARSSSETPGHTAHASGSATVVADTRPPGFSQVRLGAENPRGGSGRPDDHEPAVGAPPFHAASTHPGDHVHASGAPSHQTDSKPPPYTSPVPGAQYTIGSD